MDQNIIITAIAVVAGVIIGMLAMHYIAVKNPTSVKEQALVALDKAARAVADMNDPGPEQQAAIAARVAREEALRASIAGSMAKITPVPPAA